MVLLRVPVNVEEERLHRHLISNISDIKGIWKLKISNPIYTPLKVATTEQSTFITIMKEVSEKIGP